MISSSFSLSINIKSRVPVLLLVILNGASKSYTISWLYQNLSSRVLNEFRDFAVTTVSGRLFHGSVIRIGNTCFLKFSLALCVNSFRECPLFLFFVISHCFSTDLVQIRGHKCCVLFYRLLSCLLLIFDMLM